MEVEDVELRRKEVTDHTCRSRQQRSSSDLNLNPFNTFSPPLRPFSSFHIVWIKWFFSSVPLPSLSLHSQAAGPLLFSCPGDWAGIDWRSCQLFEQCAVVALSLQLCLQGASRSSLSATCAAQVETLSKLQDHSSNTFMRPQTLGKQIWTRSKIVNLGVQYASVYLSQWNDLLLSCSSEQTLFKFLVPFWCSQSYALGSSASSWLLCTLAWAPLL